MKRIFVLGSLNMDLVISTPYIPSAGETMYGSGFMTNPGGKGANQAVACAKLGGRVLMCGCVGKDLFGNTLLKGLSDSGVATEHIQQVDKSPTGVAMITVCEQDNRIILDPGANYSITKERIDSFLSCAQKQDLLLVQLEIPLEMVEYGLKRAKEIGMETLLNPAPANDKAQKLYRYVDIIIPNETELEMLTGAQILEDGILMLANQGIKAVIVTLGKKGYCYYQNGSMLYGKGIDVNAVDTTAAGDTFCGALAVKLAENCRLSQALNYANCAAALAVTKSGAQASIPTKIEVDAMVAES